MQCPTWFNISYNTKIINKELTTQTYSGAKNNKLTKSNDSVQT